MPRISAASLEVATLDRARNTERLAAPVHICDAEMAVWMQVVNDQPADAFRATHAPLLELYCRHIVNARVIAELQAGSGGAGGLSVIIAGEKVGAFVTDGPADPNFSLHSMDSGGLLAVSDKGYFFEVSLGENDDGSPSIVPEGALAPATTYYTQADCAGTKYLAIPYGGWRFMWRQGFVVAATDPTDTEKAYRAKGIPAELSMFSYHSRTSSSAVACTNLAVAEVVKSLPLVPNDASVTGLQDEYAGVVQLLPR